MAETEEADLTKTETMMEQDSIVLSTNKSEVSNQLQLVKPVKIPRPQNKRPDNSEENKSDNSKTKDL
jgi:hypothetical protein